MTFLGKMCLMMILRVTGFSLSLEDTLIKKPHGEGQIDPPPFAPPGVLGLRVERSLYQLNQAKFDTFFS